MSCPLSSLVVQTEEAAENGVIQTAVHIDDVELVEHLVTRVATVQTDGVELHGLLAPCVVGSIENLRAVFIHNGEDAAYIISEDEIIFHRAVLTDGDGIAVEVVELACLAVFALLLIGSGIDDASDIFAVPRQFRVPSFLVWPIAEVHPEPLAGVFNQLNLAEVVEGGVQCLSWYLPVSVLHLCHSMRADIPVVSVVAHSGLGEDVAVGRIAYLHGFSRPALHGNKPVEIVVAEGFLRVVGSLA